MVPAAALVCVRCREGDQCRLEKVEFDAEAISNLIARDSLHSPFTSSSRLEKLAGSFRVALIRLGTDRFSLVNATPNPTCAVSKLSMQTLASRQMPVN